MQAFTASVTGNSNTAVTWSMSSSANCGGSIGSSTGVYTAPTSPATLPSSPCQVTITATSNADNATTGQALADVHVVVSVSPVTDTIGQGANRQFAAAVIGTSNQTVNWSATGGGTFDPNNLGLYVAGSLPGGTTSQAVSVTATSDFDPAQFASANLTVQQSDPIGTVSSSSQISCPGGGVTDGTETCYSLPVACDGVATETVYLKVNVPSSPKGTVMFLVGSGGSGLYDDPISSGFAFGTTTVQNVFDAGFDTVQVSFGAPFVTTAANGWLQGPGGVRRLACRYSTIADWVYKNPKTINPANTSAANSAPMCATGNSAGSSAIAYAVSEYGLNSEFAMIEPTSGPVTTRIDQGCNVCSAASGPAGPCAASGAPPVPMCYSSFDAAIIDAAYQPTQSAACSSQLSGTSNSNSNMFLSDSILFDPSNSVPLPLPNLTVDMLFGGMDNSNAVPQGGTWELAVRTTIPKESCVADAPHAIPNVLDGAQQIATAIINDCH
jgi:hypothetical protein